MLGQRGQKLMNLRFSTPVADPAQPFRFYPTSSTVNTCTGQALKGTALARGVVHVHEDDGRTHLFLTIGLIRHELVSQDGTSYRGVNRQVEQVHGTVEEGQSITFVGHTVITSEGPGPTELIHVTRRLTVDENGEVTFVVDRLVFECVGG
jgi:hypothetical protein